MGILTLLSKIIPEGNVKDILRYPVYSILNRIKFVKKEVTLYKDIKGVFCFLPGEKPEGVEEIKGYLNKYIPKKGDIVIDCGAHIGYFTVLASKLVGKEGRVIAVEPDLFNRMALKKNIKANNLNNITIIKKGLSNKEGTIGWSVGGIVSQAGKSKIYKVKTTTFDKLYENLNLNKIDLIKMDIEGAEIKALNGAKNTLKHTKNIAIASYHVVNGKKTCFKVEKILKQNKFKVITKDIGQVITFGDDND